MRLDKYLKVTGLIPRRTVAKEACEAGRVTLNGRPAKSSAVVDVDDQIGIDLGRGRVDVVVLGVPRGSVSRRQRTELYRVLCEGPAADGDETGRVGSEGSP